MNTNATRNRPDARSTTIFQRRLLPVLIAGCFAGNVSANPLGPQVVNGQVGFSNQGNVLSVTNTPGSIINWQSFSINPGEITRFIQQNPNSAVLNRIIGQDPSRILGALQSNGRVFLINPNGILFGQGAQVDVNGLVASTLNITNEDFLTGRLNFRAGDRAADLKNQGAITTPNGGQVFLIAPNVENSGIITSPQGDVLLAAGRSVQLVDSMNPDLHVVISAPENEALNLGQVIAQGGRTGIYGALVRQRGIVNANSAVVGENGKVVLKASRMATLEAGSETSATGEGMGGEIHVLGERVGLMGDAQVDARGKTGGGTVLVGGDYQGQNLQVENARHSYVSRDAVVKADATVNGNGGKVIVWADETARVYGTISAKGGEQGGDGGFVETSGKSYLDFNARIDVSANNGKFGTVLLDPTNITVVAAPPTDLNGDGTTGDNLTALTELDDGATDFSGMTSVITTANMDGLLNSGNLTLSATNDINWNVGANLTYTGGVSRTLALLAGNTVSFNGTISSSSAALNVDVFSDTDVSGAGAIKILGGITTNGGGVKLAGGATGLNNAMGTAADLSGVSIGSIINTGAGGITIKGSGFGGTNYGHGIAVQGGTLQTTSGNIQLNGTGGGGIGYNNGIDVSSTALISTQSGSISLTGNGGSPVTTGPGNSGVVVSTDAVIRSTGAGAVGAITIMGTGADSNSSPGVNFMSGSKVETVDANVTIQGFASNTGSGGMDGVRIQSSGVGPSPATEVKSTGTGTITITGTGGTGGGSGLYISGAADTADVLVSSVGANISLSGYSTHAGNAGVYIGIQDTAGETSGIKSTSGAISILGNNTGGGYGLDFNDVSTSTGGWVIGGSAATGLIKISASSTGADSVNFGTGFKIASTGDLELGPSSPGSSVGLMGGVGAFNLSSTELARIDAVTAGTFPNIYIGAPTGSGTITAGGALGFGNRNLILRSPNAGGSIVLNGAVNVGTGQLTLNSAGAVSQTESITAGTLAFLGGGAFNLSHSSNAVGSLGSAATIGSLEFAQSGDLTLTSLSTTGSLGIKLTGANSLLTMSATSALSGSGIMLSADRFAATTGSITSSGGYVWFRPSTQIPLGTPRPILIGGTNDASTNLELSAAELNLVDVGVTGTLAVGDFPGVTSSSTGAIEIAQTTTLASAKVGNLALLTPYGVTQAANQALNVDRLTVIAQQTVDLDNANNQIYKVAASVGKSGDAARENQNFTLKSTTALNVDAADMSAFGTYGTISGISIMRDGLNFDSGAANSVVALISGGELSQSAGALLSGKAVYAEGSRVSLTQSNPTGVIAGKSTSGATGDMFRYTSSNGIFVTTVNSFAGVQSASTVDSAGVQLSAGASGIFQSSDAPITSSKGLTLTTTGPIDLRAASNSVAALSASNAGSVNFFNSGALELGVGGAGISTSNQAIDIKSGGLLTVRENVNAGAGAMALEAPDIQLGTAGAAGPTIQAGMVSLRANESAFNGWLMTAGTSATTITSASGIALEADNMDLTTRAPVFNAVNEVSYHTYSDNRSITIGGACNVAEPNCLKLNFGGVTNHAPDLVIGNKVATDTNTAGDIYVDAALTHPDYVEGATNASGRVALITGGKISQTAVISATSLGFIAGTVTSTSTVNLNQANAISNVAGETNGGSITLNNTSALNVVQMTGGNPLYSEITTVNGLSSNGGGVSLTNAGNVNLSAPVSAGTAAVNFTVTGGAINGSGLITGGSLTASASSGIGNATALSTSVGTLDVTNSSADSIGITNSGALNLQNATQTGAGAISIVNSGDLTVGTVTTTTGAISLSAYHKITVTGPVTSTGGNITLAAIGSGVPGNGDTLTINGSVSTNGNIALSAGDDIVISNPANVNAGSGTVTNSPNLNGPVSPPPPPPPPPPTVAECTTNPNLAGCSSVLPSLDSCAANPTLAGCTAVLPSVDTCTTNPTLAGCTAVLPSVDTCTTNPTLAGCTAVLPSVDTCTTNPTLAGCTAVLPTLSTCTTNPTQAGCTAVLPTLSTCTTNPTQAGCTAVLPTLSTCTTNPTQAGCTAVLPTLSTCTTNPTQAGCTAVLPALSTCTTNPTQAGCTAVLPSVAQCIAAPTTPGCSAVPTMTSCTANPLLAGCSSVLPTLEACTTSPTQTGCSVVLPSMTTCTTNPAQAGCSAVLPTLASCATNPTQTGCTAVLPSLDTCTTNPTQTGCAVVLPTLSSCTTAPTQPGCSVVLPSLDSCTANQAQAGCTAVLPSVQACLSNSALGGCSTVLSSTSRCLREPTLPECQPVLPPDVTPAPPPVVLPPAETSPVVSVENSVIQHTAVSTPAMQTTKPSQPSGTSSSSTSSTASSSTSSSSTSSSTSSSSTSSASERTSSTSSESTQQEASDDKKDEKKTTSSTNDSGATKNEPVRKMYCN